MTPRERFHETMRYGRPDRAPWWEEGLRDDVLDRWRAQGLAEDADLTSLFHYDRRERIELDLTPHEGSISSRLPDGWAEHVETWRSRDHVLELPIHRGLFLSLGAREWSSVETVLYRLADAPSQVREEMDIHADLSAHLAERVLSEVEVDFASFSEPIGGNDGPLISPAMYRDVVLASYRPVLDVLHRHGVETIVFCTYANARCLLPDILDAGFNCLWAIETETDAMDYRSLRQQFGRSLRLIGGIDLDCLRQDEAAIEREIKTKVPPLLADGGYIPVADARVRADIPYQRYVHYRRALERVMSGH